MLLKQWQDGFWGEGSLCLHTAIDSGMQTQAALSPEPILPLLQQHGAAILRWLVSLSRSAEPSRMSLPVREPDAPSRPHIPPRQPYPSRQERRTIRRRGVRSPTVSQGQSNRPRMAKTTPPHGATRRGR